MLVLSFLQASDWEVELVNKLDELVDKSPEVYNKTVQIYKKALQMIKNPYIHNRRTFRYF